MSYGYGLAFNIPNLTSGLFSPVVNDLTALDDITAVDDLTIGDNIDVGGDISVAGSIYGDTLSSDNNLNLIIDNVGTNPTATLKVYDQTTGGTKLLEINKSGEIIIPALPDNRIPFSNSGMLGSSSWLYHDSGSSTLNAYKIKLNCSNPTDYSLHAVGGARIGNHTFSTDTMNGISNTSIHSTFSNYSLGERSEYGITKGINYCDPTAAFSYLWLTGSAETQIMRLSDTGLLTLTAGLELNSSTSNPGVNAIWYNNNDSELYFRANKLTNQSTSPGGSNAQIQFNNSGVFAGSNGLTWDGSNLSVGEKVILSDGIDCDVGISRNDSGNGSNYAQTLSMDVGYGSVLSSAGEFYKTNSSVEASGLVVGKLYSSIDAYNSKYHDQINSSILKWLDSIRKLGFGTGTSSPNEYFYCPFYHNVVIDASDNLLSAVGGRALALSIGSSGVIFQTSALTAAKDEALQTVFTVADDQKITIAETATLKGKLVCDDTTQSYSDVTGSIQTDGGLGVVKNANFGSDVFIGDDLYIQDNIRCDGTADSTSTTTGSIQTDGGLGVVKSAHIGSDLTIDGKVTISSNDVGGSASDMIRLLAWQGDSNYSSTYEQIVTPKTLDTSSSGGYIRLSTTDTGEIFRDTSSIRFKTNFRDAPDLIQATLGLEPCVFDFKNGKCDNQIGILAEDAFNLNEYFADYQTYPAGDKLLENAQVVETNKDNSKRVVERFNDRGVLMGLVQTIQWQVKNMELLQKNFETLQNDFKLLSERLLG